MKLLGLDFRRLDDVDLSRYQASAPSYDEVGSTLDPNGRPGPRAHERRVTLGGGAGAFDAGRRALRSWRPQRSIGASITPEGVRPDLGETVVLGLGLGAARLVVPNRIVTVIDEPDRYGYAYGTLPGHPERGEELFLIERQDDGEVILTIRVDAQPAEGFGRLGFAIGGLQRLALRRYLTAVAHQVG